MNLENLEIVKDSVRKPRTGETAGDARDGAHIWTSEAMRKNYGETNPTLDDVESMEIKLQEIGDEIDDLLTKGRAVDADIEKGESRTDLPPDSKARAKAFLLSEKTTHVENAEKLEVRRGEIREELKHAQDFLAKQKKGLPPIEFTLPPTTVH